MTDPRTSDEAIERDQHGHIVWPKKIKDGRVRRIIETADAEAIRALERELRSRFPHHYDRTDPRRHRFEQRLALVQEAVEHPRKAQGATHN